MKKIIVLVSMLLFTCSCANINKLDYKSLLKEGIESNIKLANTHHAGYKYYLPQGLKLEKSKEYNDQIRSEKYKYYLFVDVISYYNRKQVDYQKKENVFYSESIKYNDHFGYLEIKKTSNEKYFIEIMYNYAKIEVMVEEIDLKLAIINSISILSSMEYNDAILESILSDNVINHSELEFNIFETADTENNYLQYVEENDDYEEETIYDTDLIG